MPYGHESANWAGPGGKWPLYDINMNKYPYWHKEPHMIDHSQLTAWEEAKDILDAQAKAAQVAAPGGAGSGSASPPPAA